MRHRRFGAVCGALALATFACAYVAIYGDGDPKHAGAAPDAMEPAFVEIIVTPPEKAIHPGEIVRIPYAVKNTSKRPLLMAVNHGDSGLWFAARTVRFTLEHEASKTKIEGGLDAGCPVGEGFSKEDFVTIEPGKQVDRVLVLPWHKACRDLREIARGEWRLRLQYERSADMKPGHLDESRDVKGEELQALWDKTAVVSSASVEIKLRVEDWNADAISALRKRIRDREIEAIKIATSVRFQEVFDDVADGFKNRDSLPIGKQQDLLGWQIDYFATMPCEKSRPLLLEVIEDERIDYRQHYSAVHALGAYPDEEIGPWVLERFKRDKPISNGRDRTRYVQDKLLAVLAACKYQTNDAAVLAYMKQEIADANRDRLGDTSLYMLGVCEALGKENTHDVIRAIKNRHLEIRDADRRTRVGEVLAKVGGG